MSLFYRLSLLCLLFFCYHKIGAENKTPEHDILIIEHFIPKAVANDLMLFYQSQNNHLNVETDNQISLHSIHDPYIRQMIFAISEQILSLLKQSYPLTKKYHLDHAGLYARMEGNFCPYHADNVYFSCPVHGANQQQLRTTCNGNCQGAKFIPNHTYWREYTALLYLNDDFEGGQIVFEDGPHNKLYRKTIPIQSNLLVIAPNGSLFYHEVLPIRKGKRYSLHFWYTSDPRHQLHY